MEQIKNPFGFLPFFLFVICGTKNTFLSVQLQVKIGFRRSVTNENEIIKKK